MFKITEIMMGPCFAKKTGLSFFNPFLAEGHKNANQDKYSDIINLKIEVSDKTSEAENNKVEDQ